jgi:chromate transporter
MPLKQKLQRCADLFWTFFKIGAVSFGGGYAMLPMLEREIVTKRAWTTQDILYDYYAIGQCTPGIIMVNVATFIGYTQAGILGGTLATAGIVTPSLVIITVIASFLQNFADIPIVQKAFAGINVAVAALLTKAMWDFGKKSIKSVIGLLLFVGAFVAMTFFHVNSMFVIFMGAAVGIIVATLKARNDNRKNVKRNKDTDDGTH